MAVVVWLPLVLIQRAVGASGVSEWPLIWLRARTWPVGGARIRQPQPPPALNSLEASISKYLGFQILDSIFQILSPHQTSATASCSQSFGSIYPKISRFLDYRFYILDSKPALDNRNCLLLSILWEHLSQNIRIWPTLKLKILILDILLLSPQQPANIPLSPHAREVTEFHQTLP